MLNPQQLPQFQPRPALGRLAAALAILSLAPAYGQTPPGGVRWMAALAPDTPAKAGGTVTIQLDGAIDEGWHVYGLKQLPGGPTPLRVKLDDSDTAVTAGAATESTPTTIHDARFGVDTQFHTGTVTVQLPVQLQAGVTGQRQIPVSVRFQLCSEHECQSPRTTHLAVAVEVP